MPPGRPRLSRLVDVSIAMDMKANHGMPPEINNSKQVFYWIVPCTCRRGHYWIGRDTFDIVVLQRGNYATKGDKLVMIDNPTGSVMAACTRFGCLGRFRTNYAFAVKAPDMTKEAYKKLKALWLEAGAIDMKKVLPPLKGQWWFNRGGIYLRLMGVPKSSIKALRAGKFSKVADKTS